MFLQQPTTYSDCLHQELSNDMLFALVRAGGVIVVQIGGLQAVLQVTVGLFFAILAYQTIF